MPEKVTACSSVVETKQTEELEKTIAQDLQKEDKPIKDLLDEKHKEDENE